MRRTRLEIDPLPRYHWHYEQLGRFHWEGDYGPQGLIHTTGWRAFTERGIRRKLARLIRRERRQAWMRYHTRREGKRR